MESRQEPRFAIQAQGRITPLENPEREFGCVLADISATGIKLVGDESLTVDEIIALEADEHLVLASIRYSQPRGDKYTIGAERIHAMNKASLPQEKAKIERIRALVEDFVRNGPEGDRPAETRPAARGAEIERKLTAFIEQRGGDSSGRAPASAPVAPKTSQQPTPHGRRRVLLEACASLCVIVLVFALFGLFTKTGGGRDMQRPVASPTSPAKLGASPQALPLAAQPPVQAVQGNGSGKRHAEIKVLRTTWVSVVVDGKEVPGKALHKGDVREIEFSDKALVRVDDAAGVQISLDGTPIGPLGGHGRKSLVELSVKGHRLLPLD